MLYITVKTCNRKDAVKHFFYQSLFNFYCFNFQVQERELYYILWRLWHLTEYYSNFKSNIHFLSCSGLFKRDFSKIFDNVSGFLGRLCSIFKKILDFNPGIDSKTRKTQTICQILISLICCLKQLTILKSTI